MDPRPAGRVFQHRLGNSEGAAFPALWLRKSFAQTVNVGRGGARALRPMFPSCPVQTPLAAANSYTSRCRKLRRALHER